MRPLHHQPQQTTVPTVCGISSLPEQGRAESPSVLTQPPYPVRSQPGSHCANKDLERAYQCVHVPVVLRIEGQALTGGELISGQ